MRSLLIFSILFFFSCTNSNEKSVKPEAPAAVTPVSNIEKLFVRNAKDWHTTGDAHWIISDNFITGVNGLGFLVTNKTYKNFILEAEFYPDPVVNSGIFIRCPRNEFSPTSCYEMNIWDNHKNQDFRTGAIVTHGKPLTDINTVGKWNKYKIKAVDNRIEVWINDMKTADLTDGKTASGYIGFQVDTDGKIRFRNVTIETL